LENELANNLKSIITNQDYELMEDLFEQANGMNQQEIVTAYQEGTKDNFNSPHFGSGLNYFRETYKK
jgi:translation elongation factor EF-G